MSLGPCMWVPFGTCSTKTAEFRFVAGPRCNRTIGVRGLPKKINFLKKNRGYLYKLTPKKALFRGVWGLILVPPNGKPALGETPGHLGTRMHTRTCHGTSQIVAENVMRSTKNVKMAQKWKRLWRIQFFRKFDKAMRNHFLWGQSFPTICNMSILDNVALIDFCVAK